MAGRIIIGDALESLKALPSGLVQCCVTSPPYYGLRDYKVEGQLGQEKSHEEYVTNLVNVFREVKRVLRDDGTLWLNLGDSYVGGGRGGGSKGCKQRINVGSLVKPTLVLDNQKPKDLLGIPWRVAFALQADGWYLRQDIIWSKRNAMPESVTDRCVKAHEYIFLLSKSPRYFFDNEAIREPASKGPQRMQASQDRVAMKSVGPHARGADGFNHQYQDDGRIWAADGKRTKRSVWDVTTKGFKGAHFAVFPPDLIEPCIKAGTSEFGCCEDCLSPYSRKVKRERKPTRPGTNSTKSPDPQRHVTVTSTEGWQHRCTCYVGVTPCTVLDPFAGSGTTGMVSKKLGRDYILIDLNESYKALMHERIGQ